MELIQCKECSENLNSLKGLCNHKYLYKGEKKIYHPDFYIPSLNLIVEIKSSYYFKRDKYIINKKKEACLNAGYKWKIIINKNYESFSEV